MRRFDFERHPIPAICGAHEVEADGNDRRAECSRALQNRHEGNPFGASFRNCAARTGIQETVHAQSSKARPKTEAEILFPRLCRRCLEWRRGVFALASQCFVGKALTHDLRYRHPEAVVVVHILTVVVTERLFVQVAKQVERLDADVGSFQAALKQRPKIFDAVGMYVSANVLFGMIDDLMHVISRQTVVGTPRIAEHIGAALDVLAHYALKRRATGIRYMAQADFFALAIQQAHYYSLAAASSASAGNLGFLILVHEASGTANERLVNLDFSAAQFAAIFLHCQPDAMKHEPCGFLGHAKPAMQLPRADAVLVVYDHPDRRQPLMQTERRILEYCSGLQAELRAVVLAVAFPDARLFEIDDVIGITSRTADNTVRPAKFNHEFVTVIVILEVDNRFSKCASKFHDSEVTKS
jgi:hypothetical protein